MNSENAKIAKRVSDALEDYQDGNLNELQIAELRELLNENPEARQAFCEHNMFSHLVSSKYLLDGSRGPSTVCNSANLKHRAWIAIAIAASLLVGIGITAYSWNGSASPVVLQNRESEDAMTQVSFRPESPERPVAVLVNVTNATWDSEGLAGVSGAPLRRGWLELASGSASIRFDCGAVVTLIGPSRFRIVDSKEGFLASGSLVANVPQPAIGFQIHTNAMQLTDLGTEFGIRVGADDETEVHVIKGLVEVECETENSSETFEMKKNQAKKFVSKISPDNLPMDHTFAEKVFPSQLDQRIGYYMFRSVDNGDGTWTTEPSAESVGGDDVSFQDFVHVGVEPGPIEVTQNLNRWSFKSWREAYRKHNFYVGFTVMAEPGKLIQPNQLSLELFRAWGEKKSELAPQDGIVLVSSDGFKTDQRFTLLDNDTFVKKPKFVSLELGNVKPAAKFEFRFLFKGRSKYRAIRLDEVTLDLDVVDAE